MSGGTKRRAARETTTTWLAIACLVLTAAGCARSDWIQSTLVTVDVTGVWRGRYVTTSSGDLELTLEQSGPKVTGQLKILGGNLRVEGPMEGTVNGDMFRFRETKGAGGRRATSE